MLLLDAALHTITQLLQPLDRTAAAVVCSAQLALESCSCSSQC
jgi:hypothetical protein